MTEEIIIDPQTTIIIDPKTKAGEITLNNNSINGKAFKIWTTMPRNYTVHPSIGIIQPLRKTQIEIHIQEGTTPESNHKFLIKVFQFDWKKGLDAFREAEKTNPMVPILKKTLGVKIAHSKGIEFKLPIQTKDYINWGCYGFLGLQFLILVIKMVS